jgi:hypothetical protein
LARLSKDANSPPHRPDFWVSERIAAVAAVKETRAASSMLISAPLGLGGYGEQSVSAFGPHCRFRRSGQPPRPKLSTGAKSANWPLWTIVAQLPHLWQIFVASILTALAMVNHNCDGFGPYQYCLDARTVFAIPVAPSDVSERNAIVEAEDWGHP